MTTKLVELIYTEDRRGLGEEDDPIRLVPQLWTKDGELICEVDPTTGKAKFKYPKNGLLE